MWNHQGPINLKWFQKKSDGVVDLDFSFYSMKRPSNKSKWFLWSAKIKVAVKYPYNMLFIKLITDFGHHSVVRWPAVAIII